MRISDWSSDVCSSDLLDEDTTVEVVSVAKEDLGAPPPNEDYFDFVAAFDLNVEGGEINGPLQIGAPVSPDVGAPGDEVYFFQLQELPIGENGELVETWVMLDNGTIDANGVARTNSPQFPGLNKTGKIMIARASQPMQLDRAH